MADVYTIQKRVFHHPWDRMDNELFAEPLDALERRDDLRYDQATRNDGVDRGYRVVDQAANVIEYGEREA